MRLVAVYEAKTRLSELLVEVEKGEQFTITRRGEAIARLVSMRPADGSALVSTTISQRTQVEGVFARLRDSARDVTLEGDLQAIAAEGRD